MEFRESLNIESLAQVAKIVGDQEEIKGAQIITVGEGRPTFISLAGGSSRKIPRPPNAFMLYANTWRRKLARIHPGESNKEISIRLGKLWKTMSLDEKETYYRLAREVDAEHKRKYPDYVYNPKEARLRKALRDQGRIQRPRQKWKPSTASQSGQTPVLQMLNQREEEIRNQEMLQNYNDAFPDLSYPHLNMPPAGDYALVAPGPEQPWYNAYIHHGGGLQNGGEMFGRDSKGPEWGSYHSDQGSPYMPQQINNNNSDGHYPPLQQVPQVMGQQMQIEGSMIMGGHDQMPGTSQDPLLISDVHNEILTNGVDNTHLESTSSQIKEEENLPRFDGPQATIVRSTEGNKDVLRLPGFHQTFGNITEIGRFSQHDDYFESRPSEVEQPKILVSSNETNISDDGYIFSSTGTESISYTIWPSSEYYYSQKSDNNSFQQDVGQHYYAAIEFNGKCDENDEKYQNPNLPIITGFHKSESVNHSNTSSIDPFNGSNFLNQTQLIGIYKQVESNSPMDDLKYQEIISSPSLTSESSPTQSNESICVLLKPYNETES